MINELDVTIMTVESMLQFISPNITISLLLNGGKNPDLLKQFSISDRLKYYESTENLGVAGGRNFLLNTTECKEAEIVMFLDNDVLPTSDLITDMTKFLFEHEEAGVIGSTLLKYPVIVEKYSKHFDEKNGSFGNQIKIIDNKTIRKIIIKDHNIDNFDHIGTNPDYNTAYLSSIPTREYIENLLGWRESRFQISLMNDPSYLEFYNDDGIDYFEITNNAGATQMFRRKLIDEIGLLDDLFNPYGFEDVDFSIRAIKMGYKNYCLTKSFLLHGTDYRHKKRVDTKSSYNRTTQNKQRVDTILFYKHIDSDYETAVKRKIVRMFILELVKRKNPVESLLYRLKGFAIAKDQIENS